MSTFEFICAYEAGEVTDQECIEGFAQLVKSGLAWSLQGTYGRTAVALIEAGLISSKGEIL